jgi:hypothetical protein
LNPKKKMLRTVFWVECSHSHLKKFGRGNIVPGSNRVNYEDASNFHNFHNAVFNIRDLVKYAAKDEYLIELSKSKIPALRHLVCNEIFVAEVKNAGGMNTGNIPRTPHLVPRKLRRSGSSLQTQICVWFAN